MKLAFLALWAVAALPLTAQRASAQDANAVAAPQKIIVSCYRGPWNDVIWDRANRSFVDSLMANGYDLVTAEAIGDWVCRDPAGVDDPEALVAIARKIIAETPPNSR